LIFLISYYKIILLVKSAHSKERFLDFEKPFQVVWALSGFSVRKILSKNGPGKSQQKPLKDKENMLKYTFFYLLYTTPLCRGMS